MKLRVMTLGSLSLLVACADLEADPKSVLVDVMVTFPGAACSVPRQVSLTHAYWAAYADVASCSGPPITAIADHGACYVFPMSCGGSIDDPFFLREEGETITWVATCEAPCVGGGP